jgi:hypothetical protein
VRAFGSLRVHHYDQIPVILSAGQKEITAFLHAVITQHWLRVRQQQVSIVVVSGISAYETDWTS